jgi:hypothetical protein
MPTRIPASRGLRERPADQHVRSAQAPGETSRRRTRCRPVNEDYGVRRRMATRQRKCSAMSCPAGLFGVEKISRRRCLDDLIGLNTRPARRNARRCAHRRVNSDTDRRRERMMVSASRAPRDVPNGRHEMPSSSPLVSRTSPGRREVRRRRGRVSYGYVDTSLDCNRAEHTRRAAACVFVEAGVAPRRIR